VLVREPSIHVPGKVKKAIQRAETRKSSFAAVYVHPQTHTL
jgi:hypothetical protein